MASRKWLRTAAVFRRQRQLLGCDRRVEGIPASRRKRDYSVPGLTGFKSMPVGVLVLEIHLPYSHSLKEKRAALLRVRDRLRSRFNVAVAELDHQDVWQHATVGVVSISNSPKLLESVLRQVLAESERALGHDVADYSLEFF